jgi:hypothetical protein
MQRLGRHVGRERVPFEAVQREHLVIWCASRSAAISYGSILHAKLTPALCLAIRTAGREFYASLVVLHATSAPLIGTLFMACNMPPGMETWRAFHIARHDNTP